MWAFWTRFLDINANSRDAGGGVAQHKEAE
jgi:hypothetical protein